MIHTNPPHRPAAAAGSAARRAARPANRPAGGSPAAASAAASLTAFVAGRRVGSGSADQIAAALAAADVAHVIRSSPDSVRVLDDATGTPVDVPVPDAASPARRGRPVRHDPSARRAAAAAPPAVGRPRLGVVAREVTLLPRHWEWLAGQPGGASAALRRLIDAARRDGAGVDTRRQARERTYRAMSALAGDLPGFEEAARALFADTPDAAAAFARRIAAWPPDIRAYLERQAQPTIERPVQPPIEQPVRPADGDRAAASGARP
ncbi:MAG: DUF2239 family protein [Lautropia sp.]